MILTTVFVVIIATAMTFYLALKYKFSYWAARGIPYIKPKIPFGNLQVFGKKAHIAHQLNKLYWEKKGCGPICGIFFFIRPVALLLDIKLIRNILITDFQSFHDHGTFYNEKDDPLSAHLFHLEGDRWRRLRSKLTPTFTSGKMKFMYPTIVSVAEEFQKCVSGLLKDQKELEMRDLLGRFTTDVIGKCAFGIECNSLMDPNTIFRQMGKKVFDSPKLSYFQRLIAFSSRRLTRLMKISLHHKDVTEFFTNTVKENVQYRESNNVHRNDFMELLIQLKNDGYLKDDASNKVGQLTMQEIAAQAFVFFLAGFHPTSTVMGYSIYELALNKKIQDKAREEINTILKKHNGELTYEALNEMVYCEQIINETLRKYPPSANLIRVANKDYKIPGTDITIEKGIGVWVPVYAIQHDPEYYPDPEVFDPARFTPEEINKRPSCLFMSFGDGPRNCVGIRFAMLQMQIGLVTLIRSFEFSTCNRTDIPLEFTTVNMVLTPKNALWFSVRALD